GRNVDPARRAVRFNPQDPRARLSARGAEDVDASALESNVTGLDGPEPPGADGREGLQIPTRSSKPTRARCGGTSCDPSREPVDCGGRRGSRWERSDVACCQSA